MTVKLKVELEGDPTEVGLALNHIRRWMMSRHEGNRLELQMPRLKGEAHVEETTVVESRHEEARQDEPVAAAHRAAIDKIREITDESASAQA